MPDASEMPGTPQEKSSPPHPGRRIVAVLALLGGIGLGWWQWQQRGRELRVVWLLTHAELARGDIVLDHTRLVQFHWQVPTPGDAANPMSRQVLTFPVGQAPAATREFTLRLPAGVEAVEIGCQFALATGAEPLRSKGSVRIDGDRDDSQTIDIDRCGEPVP